ncbi:MAG TPA: uroporphyrinogen-III synthase [Acidimicrobiales bacterium]|nr:uroporphyrinogen-III synthase [Acidimicrobiales bacterium]
MAARTTPPVVGITADRRWEEQADLLRRRGIEVLHGPTMRTVDLAGDDALRSATSALVDAPPSLLVATTGMGMRAWFSAADGWGQRAGLLSALGGPGVTVVARGAKSSSVLRQAGLPVAWRAPSESMADVVSWVEAAPPAVRSRVALQLFDPDGHPSTAAIRAVAGELVEVPVYKWLPPADPAPAERLVRSAVAAELAAVTFTSQPAVHFLFDLADSLGLRAELLAAFATTVLAVCIGPVCAEALAEEGVERTVWPEPFRLPPMVRLVAERLGVDQTSP